MEPPAGTASPSRWISKYLNTRYFQFPAGLTIKAREGWDYPRSDKDRNILRTLSGQKSYLDQHAIASGTEALSSVKVHWWILKDEPAITNNSGYIESAGHVAALYQNELYDRATARSGTAMLQRFGVVFGCRQVVLYAEPVAKEDALTTDTAGQHCSSTVISCHGRTGHMSFARTCPSSWQLSSARRRLA